MTGEMNSISKTKISFLISFSLWVLCKVNHGLGKSSLGIIYNKFTCVIRYMNKIYSCEIFIAETYPLKVFANRFAQQF